jgi:hypothetical protein
VGKKFTQHLDILLRTFTAVMRVMQESFEFVQDDAKTRAMGWLNRCAQMMEHGLDFAPMNIGANRILKNRAQKVDVLAAHGFASLKDRIGT